jgi:hypothetical protein
MDAMHQEHIDVAALQQRLVALELQVRQSKLSAKRVRRTVLLTATAVGLLSGSLAVAVTSSGVTLQQFMQFSSTLASDPPLDTSVRWSRTDPVNQVEGYTNQVLSLVAEASQTNSYTWPLYILLTGTNSPSATQSSSQSAGSTVRAFQRSLGTPWLVGYHSEVFHGQNGLTPQGLDGPAIATNGTSILYNAEMIARSTGGASIGVNIQNTARSTVQGTHAIKIQPGPQGWANGIYFDNGGAGNIGINFDQASFAMGIDLGNNSLRVNANQKLVLERFGQVFIRYNSGNGKVEIVKGGSTVVASW